MELKQLIGAIDARTAQSFVSATRRLLEVLLVEGQRVSAAQVPGKRDYNTTEIDRGGPASGWLSRDELRAASTEMAEAIAAEKWTEGVMVALRAVKFVGGL